MNEMSPRRHAELLANSLKRETIAKYLKGAQEHGGNLWEVPLPTLNNFSIEEAIDQGVYLKTMQQQISLLKEWLTELFNEISSPIEEPLSEDVLNLIEQIKELMGIV